MNNNNCVLFDRDEAGKEVNHLFISEQKPEKIYTDHVDHYGDVRQEWRDLSSAKKVLRLMDSVDAGELKYQEFVQQIIAEDGVSEEQLHRDLGYFI